MAKTKHVVSVTKPQPPTRHPTPLLLRGWIVTALVPIIKLSSIWKTGEYLQQFQSLLTWSYPKLCLLIRGCTLHFTQLLKKPRLRRSHHLWPFSLDDFLFWEPIQLLCSCCTPNFLFLFYPFRFIFSLESAFFILTWKACVADVVKGSWFPERSEKMAIYWSFKSFIRKTSYLSFASSTVIELKCFIMYWPWLVAAPFFSGLYFLVCNLL